MARFCRLVELPCPNCGAAYIVHYIEEDGRAEIEWTNRGETCPCVLSDTQYAEAVEDAAIIAHGRHAH